MLIFIDLHANNDRDGFLNYSPIRTVYILVARGAIFIQKYKPAGNVVFQAGGWVLEREELGARWVSGELQLQPESYLCTQSVKRYT